MVRFLEWLWAHRAEIAANAKAFVAWCAAVGTIWTGVATFLAGRWERPTTGSAFKRLLFDLLIDMPAWRATRGQVGITGGKMNVPLVPSRSAEDNPKKDAGGTP